MELYCSFASNSEELTQIWDRGVARISAEPSPDPCLLFASGYAFLAYFRTYLFLAGDPIDARELLVDVISRVKEDRSLGCRQLSFVIPLALEAYLSYTGDPITVTELLSEEERVLSAMGREETMQAATFENAALLLGSEFSLHRLRGACGCETDHVRQTRLLEKFHERFFKEETGCYVDERGEASPVTSVLPVALGFTHADARLAVRRSLIEESFAVPRSMRMFLYDAMASEELWDLLLPTLLEGGAPRGNPAYTDLAGVLCLAEHLMGIDLSMLGKGIRCASPHLPYEITYRATLPAGNGFLTFESEEPFLASFD